MSREQRELLLLAVAWPLWLVACSALAAIAWFAPILFAPDFGLLAVSLADVAIVAPASILLGSRLARRGLDRRGWIIPIVWAVLIAVWAVFIPDSLVDTTLVERIQGAVPWGLVTEPAAAAGFAVGLRWHRGTVKTG